MDVNLLCQKYQVMTLCLKECGLIMYRWLSPPFVVPEFFRSSLITKRPIYMDIGLEITGQGGINENNIEITGCNIKPHQKQIYAFDVWSRMRYSNSFNDSSLAFIKRDNENYKVVLWLVTSKVFRFSRRFRY